MKALERVNKEMKKQIECYKDEMAQIKKSEGYLSVEAYQKLVTDFNNLYDHYKATKQTNKKIKAELQ